MALLLYKWLLIFSLLPVKFSSDEKMLGKTLYNINNIYHPFYVSVTEIEHNKQEKTLEISCKIFSDDLEGVLKQQFKSPVNLNDAKKESQNGNYINTYISQHLKLAADGRVVKLNYVGFEKANEATYCYFEVPKIASLKKLDIENSILQDLTDQQINIMHVTVNQKRQSYKLDFPNKKASFSF